MKPDNGELLLQNKEMQQLLREMILQKGTMYSKLSLKITPDDKIDQLIQGDIDPNVIYKILNNDKVKDEIKLLERDLSSMCYQLNKSRKMLPDNTKWEESYRHATQLVQIGDVIINLFGITSFSRNITCPFHEDKNPSLKIYTKNNRFVCFSCNSRGSPINFMMKYKNCSFNEAVQYLSNL